MTAAPAADESPAAKAVADAMGTPGRVAMGVELARWTSLALLSEARGGWTADGADQRGWEGTPSPGRTGG